MENKVGERDSLQIKYDRLNLELNGIRNELSKYKIGLEQARQDLRDERQRAAENDRALREEARNNESDIRASLKDMRQRLEKSQADFAAAEEEWQSDRRAVNLLRDQAEARAAGLQNTIHKLQTNHEDADGKESRLKDVLSTEEQRHRKERNLLKGQIEQLELEIKQKQIGLDKGRTEQLRLRDDVRTAKDEVSSAERKIQTLEDEIQVLSGMVEDEQKQATEKVKAARADADSAKKQLLEIRQQKQRIENELKDVQDYTQRIPATPAATRDAKQRLEQRVRDLGDQLERLRFDKDALETKLRRSEEDHAAATRRTVELEQDLRSALGVNSHKSPIKTWDSPSSSKELEDLRKEVSDARSQANEARTQYRSTERELRNKLSESERNVQRHLREIDQLRDDLESRVMDLESQIADQESRRESAEKTVQRLRSRISGLEKDLQTARRAHVPDDVTVDERHDLEKALKEARHELEEMQSELVKTKDKVDSLRTREREQKTIVKQLQSERANATGKQHALEQDVVALQDSLSQKRKKLTKQTRQLEEQQLALQSQLPRSAALERELAENDRRHQQELAGLFKQIQWLRAKGKREEAFRTGLAFEKRFLIMNIEMYQSFNQIDLRLLERMGITPDTQRPKKRPSLRAVADMVIATVRMRNGVKVWRNAKQLKESLLVKAAQQSKMLGKRKTAA